MHLNENMLPMPMHSTSGETKRMEVLSNASLVHTQQAAKTTATYSKYEGRSERSTTSFDHVHEKTHQHSSSFKLDFHVSPLPLPSLPPLSILEVCFHIHVAPLFTGQGLNYIGFWFCKPEFIAIGLSPLTPGTI